MHCTEKYTDYVNLSEIIKELYKQEETFKDIVLHF